MTDKPLESSAVFIIMGVSSTGKSTVGARLAEVIQGKFIDGDDLHPKANVIKMSQGNALNDDDREPWLERIRDASFSIERKRETGVIVCSALRRVYRDKIREGNNNIVFLHLHADKAIIAKRMQNRNGHFMPTSLLDSQFDTLEMPTDDESKTHIIDVSGTLEDVVNACIATSQFYLNGSASNSYKRAQGLSCSSNFLPIAK